MGDYVAVVKSLIGCGGLCCEECGKREHGLICCYLYGYCLQYQSLLRLKSRGNIVIVLVNNRGSCILEKEKMSSSIHSDSRLGPMLFGLVSGLSLYYLLQQCPDKVRSQIRSYEVDASRGSAKNSRQEAGSREGGKQDTVYDVIVVGLGGHGSSIAAQCAMKGLNVLGLEKYVRCAQYRCMVECGMF
jgi:hypothetical protein